MVLPSSKKVRLHDVIYIPSLNVSLFSVKQHMRLFGCSAYSSRNTYTISFPTTLFVAENHEEIEFTVSDPSTDHTIAPEFDEATADIHTATSPISTTLAVHGYPCLLSTVQVTSTRSSQPVLYPPKQLTSDSIGYTFYSIISTFVPPQTRKSIL